MIQSTMLVLHLLSAVIWVGGMFYAYMILRPVAATLFEPPQRLAMWAQVFNKFFPWVWTAIVLLLATGYWMIFNVFGGMNTAPVYVHIMNGLGILMMLIFFHVFFAPYKRLKRAVSTQNWQEGGKDLAQIRFLVGMNTIIGLIVLAVAAGGR